MSEPTHLTRDQLAPIITAAVRHETAALLGLTVLLPPFAPCPACGQAPTELAVRNDHPGHFLTDRVAFRYRPCGHTFTADGEDLYETYTAARQQEHP